MGLDLGLQGLRDLLRPVAPAEEVAPELPGPARGVAVHELAGVAPLVRRGPVRPAEVQLGLAGRADAAEEHRGVPDLVGRELDDRDVRTALLRGLAGHEDALLAELVPALRHLVPRVRERPERGVDTGAGGDAGREVRVLALGLVPEPQGHRRPVRLRVAGQLEATVGGVDRPRDVHRQDLDGPVGVGVHLDLAADGQPRDGGLVALGLAAGGEGHDEVHPVDLPCLVGLHVEVEAHELRHRGAHAGQLHAVPEVLFDPLVEEGLLLGLGAHV